MQPDDLDRLYYRLNIGRFPIRGINPESIPRTTDAKPIDRVAEARQMATDAADFGWAPFSNDTSPAFKEGVRRDLGLPRYVVLRYDREARFERFAIPAGAMKVHAQLLGPGHQYLLNRDKETFPWPVATARNGNWLTAAVTLIYAGDDAHQAYMDAGKPLPGHLRPATIGHAFGASPAAQILETKTRLSPHRRWIGTSLSEMGADLNAVVRGFPFAIGQQHSTLRVLQMIKKYYLDLGWDQLHGTDLLSYYESIVHCKYRDALKAARITR